MMAQDQAESVMIGLGSQQVLCSLLEEWTGKQGSLCSQLEFESSLSVRFKNSD